MSDRRGRERAVTIPHTQLAPDTLRRLAEEFVTRSGTDYGAVEQSLDAKVARLMRALERGEAAIVYEVETGTVNIVPAR